MLHNIRKAREEGFTLIELLIVIIILGILAAIVVFAVGSTRSDSVTATCKTDVKSIQLAIEAVKTKTGTYPANGSSGNQADNILATASSTDGQVLKSWPGGTTYGTGTTDDLDFKYNRVTTTTYELFVYGKNLTHNGAKLTQDSPDSLSSEVAATSPHSVDWACGA